MSLVGGAAGQPWGPPIQTFQYWDREALSHGVVALGLSGPFGLEIGICHGTAPTGIVSEVTKRPAITCWRSTVPAADVWRETTGCRQEDLVTQSHFASWAVGIELNGPGGNEHVIRGAFGFNLETGAMMLQAPVPEGARVMLQHRTIDKVLNGTQEMARELLARLSGRKPWAVFGFECAARTFPFLGETTRGKSTRGCVPRWHPTPWLGMMAWGEIGPCAGRPAFHNYTYPLLVLTDQVA